MIKKIKVFDINEDDFNEGVFAQSLVYMPAIESDFIHLSKDAVRLQSVNEERRMVFGAALIPDKLILRIDEQTGEEYYVKFTKEVIRKIQSNYAKKGAQSSTTVQHQYAVTGCTVVESWIKESETDKSVHLGIEVPIGTWVIGMKVDNANVWDEVKAKSVRGFSIEGSFGIAKEIFSSVDNSFEDWLNSVLSLQS